MEKTERRLQNHDDCQALIPDTVEIFDKLNMGVIRLDNSFHLTYSNAQAADILQKSKEDLEGSHIRDILPEPFQKQLSVKLSLARREDSVVNFEDNYPLRKDLWLQCRCMPTAEGFILFFEDITERKIAEDKLKNAQESLQKINEGLEQRVQDRTKSLQQTTRRLEEQKELLLTIIDNIPVMLTFYDYTGTVRLVNREFERLAGWSLEEARNMNLVAASYPDPAYRKKVWEQMMEAKPGWKDLEITTRSKKTLQSSWANVRLSDGSLIGIGIDISERKKMEQNLQRLAGAIDQADEGIIIFNTRWEVEYVNPAFEDLSGIQKHGLIGKPLESTKNYFLDDSYQEVLRSVEKERKAWSGHQKKRRPTGEDLDINLTVSPVFDEEGGVINYISLARDVTQEFRIQQQLLQGQKMEAIGNLAAGIAHNLKNAFTPILINTEMLMGDFGRHNPSYPILEEIMQATRYGIDLVKHLLIFSRRTPQQKKPIDIVPILREALGFLRASLPSTVEINHHFEMESAEILADQTQVKQALINLGSNAGHSMRKQGGTLEVDLTSEFIEPLSAELLSSDLAPGQYIKIKVQDTGQGIDEQAVEHIFEPFFKTNDRGEGTGLGLSVVHGIVKSHSGAITVESTPGKGTTFTVMLPVLARES